MAKMSELDAALRDLIEHCQWAMVAARDIRRLLSDEPDASEAPEATEVAAQPAKPEPPEQPEPAKEPEKTWKLEEVRAFLKKKRDQGYVDEVKALLKAHGAARLPDIDPQEYHAMMREAEAIGA